MIQRPVTPRWFTVRHRNLLGGEHPCPGGDPRIHRERLRRLCERGVTTFVDLVEYDRENGVQPYRRLLPRSGRRGLPITYHHFPVPDAGVPRFDRQVVALLDVIDVCLLNSETVYLHCRSGIGRTGTLLALHLVRQGYSPSEALTMLSAAWHRDERSSEWPSCPQTEGQMRYVLASDPGS